MTDQNHKSEPTEKQGQSGAQSGNAGMQQKPGAIAHVNADANDDRMQQSGAEPAKRAPKAPVPKDEDE